MSALTLQEREEVLRLAEDLAMRLRTAQVPYLKDPSVYAAEGVSASTLSHAEAYLARVRDLDVFRRFIARFDDLDVMISQNPENPKAEHHVARREVEALLDEHPNLTADELLYLLAWTRRLLPRQSGKAWRRRRSNNSSSGRKQSSGPRGRQGTARPFKGGQLGVALQRASQEDSSGDQDDEEEGR